MDFIGRRCLPHPTLPHYRVCSELNQMQKKTNHAQTGEKAKAYPCGDDGLMVRPVVKHRGCEM